MHDQEKKHNLPPNALWNELDMSNHPRTVYHRAISKQKAHLESQGITNEHGELDLEDTICVPLQKRNDSSRNDADTHKCNAKEEKPTCVH